MEGKIVPPGGEKNPPVDNQKEPTGMRKKNGVSTGAEKGGECMCMLCAKKRDRCSAFKKKKNSVGVPVEPIGRGHLRGKPAVWKKGQLDYTRGGEIF